MFPLSSHEAVQHSSLLSRSRSGTLRRVVDAAHAPCTDSVTSAVYRRAPGSVHLLGIRQGVQQGRYMPPSRRLAAIKTGLPPSRRACRLSMTGLPPLHDGLAAIIRRACRHHQTGLPPLPVTGLPPLPVTGLPPSVTDLAPSVTGLPPLMTPSSPSCQKLSVGPRETGLEVDRFAVYSGMLCPFLYFLLARHFSEETSSP